MNDFKINLNPPKLKSKRKRNWYVTALSQEEYWDQSEPPNPLPKIDRRVCSYPYKVEYDYDRLKINSLNCNTYINEKKGELISALGTNEKKCKHSYLFDLEVNEFICVKCFVIETRIENRDETYHNTNSNIRIWRRDHDRQRWTDEDLDYCKGLHNSTISESFWLNLLREVPDEFTWYQVYKVFQKNGLKKIWMGFGDFIGMKAKLSKPVICYANKYTHFKMCENYRIPYMYLIYKFTQLYGDKDAAQTIPFKASKNWIDKADIWWKEICDLHHIPFQKTIKYKIKWNKKQIVEKLVICLKRMGIYMRERVIPIEEYLKMFPQDRKFYQ